MDQQQKESKDLWCVEYPGLVYDTEKAEQHLGGRIQMYNNVKNNQSLELKLRPNNPSAHPIIGDICQTNLFLLKLTKIPREQNEETLDTNADIYTNLEVSEQFEIKAEYVGDIKKTVRFREMPDFQYHALRRDDKFKSILTAMQNGDIDLLDELSDMNDLLQDFKIKDGRLIPMPIQFSKVRVPFEYKYKQYGSSSNKNDIVVHGRDHQTRSFRRYPFHTVDFECDQIPNSPPDNLPDPSDSFYPSQEIIKMVSDMLERRPVWLLSQLFSELRKVKSNIVLESIRNALSILAYQIKNGPWRFCWIKFGFDPRADKNARFLQIMEIRVRKQETFDIKSFFETMKSYNVDNLDLPYEIFDVTGKISQVIDIKIPEFLKLASEQNYVSEKVSLHHGWFQPILLNELREFLMTILRLPMGLQQMNAEQMNELYENCKKQLELVTPKLSSLMQDLQGLNEMETEEQIESILQKNKELVKERLSQAPKSVSQILQTTTGLRRENVLNQHVDQLMQDLNYNVDNENLSDYDLLGEDEEFE